MLREIQFDSVLTDRDSEMQQLREKLQMRELELARLKLSNLGGVELPSIHTEPSTKNSTGMLSSGRSGEGDVS